MHNGNKVVDVHGHMTTPAPFRQFLAETVAQNTPGRKTELGRSVEPQSQAAPTIWHHEPRPHGPRPLRQGRIDERNERGDRRTARARKLQSRRHPDPDRR